MLKNVFTLLFAAALIAVIATLIIYPKMNGLMTVAITANSMSPTIPQGSLVYIDPEAAYSEGSVVTYQAGTEIVTHRLMTDISGNNDFFKTQGDGNTEPDPYYVHSDAIVGVAMSYLPVLGYVAQGTQQLPVVITVILAALAVLFLPILLQAPEPKRPDQMPGANIDAGGIPVGPWERER